MCTWNAVLVSKRLQGTVGPGIQDPILYTSPGGLSLVLGLVPAVRYLGDKRILVRLGRLLSLYALRL